MVFNQNNFPRTLAGNNTDLRYTIATVGCYITSLANAFQKFGINLDPVQMNERLKPIFGQGDAILKPENISKIFPEISWQSFNGFNHDEAYKATSNPNQVVILGVDQNAKTPQIEWHWVWLRDKNWIVDPNGGVIKPLDSFPKILYTHIYTYSPKNQKDMLKDTILSKTHLINEVADYHRDFIFSEIKNDNPDPLLKIFNDTAKENNERTKIVDEINNILGGGLSGEELIAQINNRIDYQNQLKAEKRELEAKIQELEKKNTQNITPKIIDPDGAVSQPFEPITAQEAINKTNHAILTFNDFADSIRGKFSWNKFFIGLSKNAYLTGLLGILISAGVTYTCSHIPELAPYKDQILGFLAGLTGISVLGQNLKQISK